MNPFKKKKVTYLNAKSKVFFVLLENVNSRRLSITERDVFSVFDCGVLNFVSVGDDILTSCGRLSFSISNIAACMLTSKGEERKLSLCFLKGAKMEIEITPILEEKFNALIKLLALGEKPKSHLTKEGREVCPCCKERERIIRLNTECHPVSRILTELMHSGSEVKLDLMERSAQISTLAILDQVNFGDGVAALSMGYYLELPIAKIHGVRIFFEEIDHTSYSLLKVFDSQGYELFKVGTSGRSYLMNWRNMLDDVPYFKPDQD